MLRFSSPFLILSIKEIEKQYGSGAAVAIVFGVVALCYVLLFTVLMLISRSVHSRRKRRRREWGRPLGLTLMDTPEMGRGLFRHAVTEVGKKVVAAYPYASLFRGEGSMAMHILEGRVDGLFCRVFEYRYFTGSGKTVVEHHFTVVAFEFETIKPYTGLRRYGWRDPLAKIQDIQTGRKALDDAFYIYADEWGLLANEFTDQLEQIFMNGLIGDFVVAEKKMTVAARGRLKDKDYDQLFAEARQIAQWLRSKM